MPFNKALPAVLLVITFTICIALIYAVKHDKPKPKAAVSKPEVNPSTTPSETDTATRIEIFEKFMRGASFLAENSEDEEALAVMSFLEDHLVPTKISGNKFTMLVDPKSSTPIPFFIVLPNDTNIPEDLATLLQYEALAWHHEFFSPTANIDHVIIAHPSALESNSISCGVTLLHEGKHAYDWVYNPDSHPNNLIARCKSERRAHELSQRVLYKKDPVSYERSVQYLSQAIIEHQATQAVKTPVELGSLLGKIPLRWTADMERLFGVATNTHDGKTSEGGELITAALFHVGSQMFPELETSTLHEQILEGMLRSKKIPLP